MAVADPAALPGLLTQLELKARLAERGLKLYTPELQAVCVLYQIPCRKLGQLVCYRAADVDRIETAFRAYRQKRDAALNSTEPMPAA